MPLSWRNILIIGECLRAAAYGPFFPDGEFDSIFGLSRKQVPEQWPVVVAAYANQDIAVNNSLNNLIGYPNKHFAQWDDYISISRGELVIVWSNWRKEKSDDSARAYFDRLM